MEAEEKLMQAFGDDSVSSAEYVALAHEATHRRFTTLLSAAEAFIAEAESMGWGEASETALPGSFDLLRKAVDEVRG